jgi:hypothetical protein
MKIKQLSPLALSLSLLLSLSAGASTTPPAPVSEKSSLEEGKPSSKVPKMMYSLDLKKDDRRWGVGNRTSSGSVFVMELVSEGQSMQSWNELLTNMVVLGQEVGTYVSQWQQLLLEKMPGIFMEEEILPDRSIIVRYKATDESGVWRFAQGEDGVYALCYLSRDKEQGAPRLEMWEKMIKSSPLIINARP